MKKKVLVVDDSELIRNSYKMVLSSSDYDVTYACNGQEGLDQFQSQSFDLVISDVNMPIMDGLTMIVNIRKINKTIPVLTCTTETEEDMQKKGMKAGANGWVVKPFRTAQFRDIVRQMLE